MAQEYSTIKGSGPPTSQTKGAVGQDYLDVDTGIVYECVEAYSKKGYKMFKEAYSWEKKGIDMDFMATDAEVESAVNDLRDEISSGTITPGGEGISIWAEIVE